MKKLLRSKDVEDPCKDNSNSQKSTTKLSSRTF